MENHDLIEEKGKRVVLLGNEAIARGALEAGVGSVAIYPGTPSSEIGSSLAGVAKQLGIHFEWSVNEKVATEVAAGAAFCGVRALTAMKHFGLNVACDSLLPMAYTGVKGGFVVVVADDPQGHSSAQSEQDSRFFARMGNLPMIEPSTLEECKEFTKKAFEISEKYEIPVLLRSTTMVSHSSGTIRLGQMVKPKTEGYFEKDMDKFFNLMPHLLELHKRVLWKMARIEQDCARLNKVEGKGKVGIITCGASYNYVKEISPKKVKIAKLNITHPISKKFVAKFLKGLKKVIVVEELEPIIENFVREVALEANPRVKIYGKNIFPRTGELNTEIIEGGLAQLKLVRKKNFVEQDKALKKIKLPKRYPEFCQGCPHRFSLDVIKAALGEDVIWAGDIGCYSIGIFEPYNMMDFVISMGASLGLIHGIKKVSDQKIVAFIGDSTFFHAGMAGLANIIYNGSKPLIFILDNSITAMTGHQPNPGTGFNAMWENIGPIKIEEVVKGLGIKPENVAIVDPIERDKMISIIKEFFAKDEPTVIISRRMCALFRKKAVSSGLIKLGSEGKIKEEGCGRVD